MIRQADSPHRQRRPSPAPPARSDEDPSSSLRAEVPRTSSSPCGRRSSLPPSPAGGRRCPPRRTCCGGRPSPRPLLRSDQGGGALERSRDEDGDDGERGTGRRSRDGDGDGVAPWGFPAARDASGVSWRRSGLRGRGSAETPEAPHRLLVRCGTKSGWLPLSSLPAEIMIRLGESFGFTLILCVENGSDIVRAHLLPVTPE